jgi:hypothetical protein
MSWINLSAIWKIVVFGTLAGPACPPCSPSACAPWSCRAADADAGADSDHVYGGNVPGLVIAVICFLIILAALGWGIYEVYQIGHPAPVKH